MFFIFSKALFFLFQPLNWVVALLLGGVLWRKEKVRKRLLIAGVSLLVLLTNPAILNIVQRCWEPDLITMSELEEPFDLGVVLGGYSRFIEGHTERLHLTGHPNRLVHALELYQAGKVRKLLLSGGSGRLVGNKTSDSGQVRAFLIRSGVSEEDIFAEVGSRNTHENAALSATVIENDFPEGRCLLITSAVHMRRAEACFRKEGIEVETFPTDARGDLFHSLHPKLYIVPEAAALVEWESLVKEWAGFLMYWLRGYV